MMKKNNRLQGIKIIIYIMLCIVKCDKILAADSFYSFTHNMQDIVVLGEVYRVTLDFLYVKNIKIVSGEIEISDKISNTIELSYQLSANYKKFVPYEERLSPQENDNILASLNKEGDHYYLCNGLYKVDNLDIENLKVISTEENPNLSIYAKLTCYINSKGLITNFIDDEEGNVYYENSEGEQKLIYKNIVKIESNHYQESTNSDLNTKKNNNRPSIIYIVLDILLLSLPCGLWRNKRKKHKKFK